MQMPDVNLATGPEPFALCESVLHGFLRIVTNPRVFDPPSTTAEALRFLDALIERPGCCTDFARFAPLLRWQHL